LAKSGRANINVVDQGIVKIEVDHMKFIDEVYDYYKNLLTGDEEDALAIVIGLLEDHDRSDLLKLIDQMTEDEMYHMVVIYMVEMLRKRMVDDGVGGSDEVKNIH
jgi:ribosomal 50S subunit-associated protein YjgA (DUF615 family)